MLIVLFLVSHFNFLFVPCGGLSWLPVSFLLHVKYTLSYRIVMFNHMERRVASLRLLSFLLQNLFIPRDGAGTWVFSKKNVAKIFVEVLRVTYVEGIRHGSNFSPIDHRWLLLENDKSFRAIQPIYAACYAKELGPLYKKDRANICNCCCISSKVICLRPYINATRAISYLLCILTYK